MVLDHQERQTELLTLIAEGVGALNDDQSATRAGLRPLAPAQYVLQETDNLDHANPDGTATVSPGEQVRLIDYSARSDGGVALLALGATDQSDVEYALRLDNDRILGGWTNSPLGSVNDPFSFVDAYQAFAPAQSRIEYLARLDAGASSSVDLVARAHIEE